MSNYDGKIEPLPTQKKTLTEQWREGTLPAGCYYVLSTEDDTPVACDIDTVCDFMIRDVVEPVPSYEDICHLNKRLGELAKDVDELHSSFPDLANDYKCLEKKLAIATKALQYYADGTLGGSVARQAIKEMEGIK